MGKNVFGTFVHVFPHLLGKRMEFPKVFPGIPRNDPRRRQAAVGSAAMGFHEDPGFGAGSARVPPREASRAAQQKPPHPRDGQLTRRIKIESDSIRYSIR
jgi:hypothetical protein